MAQPQRPHANAPETIDPVWLLKAGAAMLAVGLVCAYVTVCALFWHGQWQLVLHPSRTPERQPADVGLQAQNVQFGDGLKGWWMPAPLAGEPTLLMLASESGNAGDQLARARTFHEAGINVMLFDYRGYGASSGQHPEQSTMRVDSESALSYLTSTAKAPTGMILVQGTGAGASLAVRLCAEHPEIKGLILEQADGDFAERARRDARASVAPFRLLFHEDFPLADPLSQLKTPKLLISYTKQSAPEVVQRAAEPKMTVEVPDASDSKDIEEALKRFLDAYVSTKI